MSWDKYRVSCKQLQKVYLAAENNVTHTYKLVHKRGIFFILLEVLQLLISGMYEIVKVAITHVVCIQFSSLMHAFQDISTIRTRNPKFCYCICRISGNRILLENGAFHRNNTLTFFAHKFEVAYKFYIPAYRKVKTV